MSERVIPVDVHGQRYPIRSALEPEYVARLAAYVDQKMRAAAESTDVGDSLRLAVLAALNIADESRRGLRPDPTIAKGGPDRVARLIDMLERCFADA